MKRNMWVAAAAGAGIIFALLMFRVPDTGGELTEVASPSVTPRPETTTASAAPPPPPTAAPVVQEPTKKPTPAPAPPETVEEKQAMAAEHAEERLEPDAAYAARASILWTGVRRELLLLDGTNDDVRALLAVTADLIQDYRAAGQHPDDADFDDLQGRSEALRQKLGRGGFTSPSMNSLFQSMARKEE